MTFPNYAFQQSFFSPSTALTSFGIGLGALASCTTGGGNVAIGCNAGDTLTTGANNTIIGNSVATTTLATGSNNILIGTSSTQDTASSSTSNTLLIGGGATAVISATGINGTPAVTIPGSLTVTGSLTTSGGSLTAPLPAGATLALTASNSGAVIRLDTAAGSVVTLPAATGSGVKYRFVVTTTASSNAHKILPASVSDFMQGNAVGHVAAGTTLSFQANPAASHSIQMPFTGTQPSGGFAGDWFEVQDVLANMWTVSGSYQSGTTSTTPFSTATT